MSVVINQSDQDKNQYRFFTLPNEIGVFLVSDPETDKASAALDVGIGFYADPEKFPGTAHFLEHLLFMGTEKYPSESEYMDFLSEHSGYSNAYTADDHTNYYFEVGSDHLGEALDRFGQFFIAPLFDPSCTERELNAVDSEHDKNIENDNWRIWQIQRHLSNPLHPFHKFGTGNSTTLSEKTAQDFFKKSSRDVIIDFYKQNYSSNQMKLVVYGKQSLDHLQKMVSEIFPSVPTTSSKTNSIVLLPPVFENAHLMKLAKVVPIKDIRELILMFPFPDINLHYKTKADRFLSHLCGHEAGGSIIILLKSKGYATSLSAGCNCIASGFSIFEIGIELTPSGLKNYTEVISIVFQYISMLKSTFHADRKSAEWIWNEVSQMNFIEWKFRDKPSHVSTWTSNLSVTMQRNIPPSDLLTFDLLMEQFDYDLIMNYLNCLSLTNCNFVLISQDFKAVAINTEPIYGTKIIIEDFPLSSLSTEISGSASHNLYLPHKNSFIPENLSVVACSFPTEVPQPIHLEGLSSVFLSSDHQFRFPKGEVYVVLRSPLSYSSASNAFLAQLFVQLLNDALMETAYFAQVAGLNYKISSTTEGIEIKCFGFSDKLGALLGVILDKMIKDFKQVHPSRFEMFKESYLRSLKNFPLEDPYKIARFYVDALTQDQIWTSFEKANAGAALQLQDLLLWYDELFKSGFNTSVLFNGNFTKDKVIEICQNEMISKYNRFNSLTNNATPSLSALIPGKETPSLNFKMEISNLNNCNCFLIQTGKFDNLKERTEALFAAQLMGEKFFDELRTKQQLGYIVSCSFYEKANSIGVVFLVQSEKSPEDLEQRIESFISDLPNWINQMNSEELSNHKISLIHKLRERKQRLSDKSKETWKEIVSRRGCFEKQLEVAQLLESDLNLTQKETVIKFLDQSFKDSLSRSKLSVHLRSNPSCDDINQSEIETLQEFRRLHKEMVKIPNEQKK